MLNPGGHRIVLLPQDRELIEIIGCTEAEYRAFVKHCYKNSKIRPGTPINFLVVPFLIQLAIGVALSAISSLLFRPKLAGNPAEIRQTSLPGQNVVSGSEYAPKAGFDSLQNVVEIGSTIPLVYAKRETINGVTYGGVRVNTNLLWSQMLSLGGGQMLRAVFLISEGGIGAIDPSQFAFGDNVLGGYDLSGANATSSRATFYVSLDGGRLTSADRIAGRSAANDLGNAENNGGSDVFQIVGLNGAWTTDFSYAFKPSTQTQFGVYSLIGNGLAFRVNPSLRPVVQVKTEPSGQQNTRITCELDGVAVAQRDKYNTLFPSFGGVVAKNGSAFSGYTTFAIGDTITYSLNSSSQANRTFIGIQFGPFHVETCRDVAQAISGRQRGWDDALTIGELYRFGSALFVCESRSPDDKIFASEADNEPIGGGQSMLYSLRCVRSGEAAINGESGIHTATNTPHILKIAIASFAIPRASQVIEIGIKSSLGIRISGLCNFRDSLSQSEIDGRACLYYNGFVYSPGQSLGLSIYQSGSFTGSETRYSFFKIGYRIAGSDSPYTYLDQCFGTRSVTQQSIYNYIRLQMPSAQRWEFRIEPVSGWEVRNNMSFATGSLEVLDAKIANVRNVVSGSGSNIVIASYSGEAVARSADTFAIAATRDNGLGLALSDTADYADAYGKLAEAFVYEEIRGSANNPEHEITHINLLAGNPNTPNYDNIALVGANLRSSTELNQLNQLSVYVNEGIGGIHTFPEVFKDQLTNTRYGVGSILSPELIDYESFEYCAQWTRDRLYFFDGAIAQPINLRQWGSQTASYFLLDFVIRNGKFSLQPAVYFDRAETITGLYTAGNIIEDSFEFVYVDVEQRIPKRISVKWRQEKANNDDTPKGLFPVIREITVREAGTPETAPIESIDISDFATSETHAIDLAKYLCRGSRLITHSVRFKTTPTQAALEIGRCFKLGLETTAYLQPNNGAIDVNGVITTTEPLSDGGYDVMLWDGKSKQIINTQINVINQSTTDYSGAVFCVNTGSAEIRAYKAQSLGFDEDGNIQVEATYFPLDEQDYSLISAGWDVEENWIIEGRIGTSENSGSTASSFTGVQIVGKSSGVVGVSSSYTAIVSGSAGAYTYSWTGTGVTFGSANAATTAVTITSAGAKTITCTVIRDGVTRIATKIVTGIDATTIATIGSLTLTGSTTASVNTATNYSVTYPGKPAAVGAGSFIVGQQYQIVSTGSTDFTVIGASSNAPGVIFTATGVGTGTGTADSLNVAFITWTWTSPTSGASASIANSNTPAAVATFLTAGAYTLRCTINSPTANDSPQTQTIAVTVT